ncbi:hypothetical protein BDR26DRAFT_931795 [Obelidium mucronatum]|nr:hypothetical protein BDR26DRAFT_931795 [Obelidium mucronatum]
MLKLYELVFDATGADRHYYGGPNGWKIHLALLQKQIPFEIVEVTHHDVHTSLSAKLGRKATSPAIELDDGTIICDSYRIAEFLEETYPNQPSLFSGSKTNEQAEVKIGKTYSFMMDKGLGDSDSEWAVWLELSLDGMQSRVVEGPNRDYFLSDQKWGKDGFKQMSKKRENEDLVRRAKNSVMPLVASLKERPGEFLQGQEPGFVDFVVFGRYAMCRNNCPELSKQVWEDHAVELEQWVQRLVDKFPSIQKHLRPY